MVLNTAKKNVIIQKSRTTHQAHGPLGPIPTVLAIVQAIHHTPVQGVMLPLVVPGVMIDGFSGNYYQ